MGKNQIYKDLKRIIISHEDMSVFNYFSTVSAFFRKTHLLKRSRFDRRFFPCRVSSPFRVDYGGYEVDDEFLIKLCVRE